MTDTLPPHDNLRALTETVLAGWPEHRRFLEASFAVHDDRALTTLEGFAAQILRLAGDELAAYGRSYRWLCDVMNREALHFLRTGGYRHSSFTEVFEAVYSNREYMQNYMNGLLISSMMWSNHSISLLFFVDRFLPILPSGFEYLEVGPGHGLTLAQVARNQRAGRVAGWDISEASLECTGHALRRLGVERPVELVCCDVLADGNVGPSSAFDAVVVSEVLEHLEDPRRALDRLKDRLRPGGYVFINAPANSPAPDHIHLFRHPDEVAALTEACGLRIVERIDVPMTGYRLDRAIAERATVNCLLIAQT